MVMKPNHTKRVSVNKKTKDHKRANNGKKSSSGKRAMMKKKPNHEMRAITSKKTKNGKRARQGEQMTDHPKLCPLCGHPYMPDEFYDDWCIHYEEALKEG